MTSEQFSGTDWYGLSAFQSGLVVSLSLAGALLGSGAALLYGDKLGRRNELLGASLLYGEPLWLLLFMLPRLLAHACCCASCCACFFPSCCAGMFYARFMQGLHFFGVAQLSGAAALVVGCLLHFWAACASALWAMLWKGCHCALQGPRRAKTGSIQHCKAPLTCLPDQLADCSA